MRTRSFAIALAAGLALISAPFAAHAQKGKKHKGGGDPGCTAKVTVESHVWVTVKVSPKGKVLDAQIAKSSGDDCLDQKGLAMARQQSYPAESSGPTLRGNNSKDRTIQVDLKIKPDAVAAAAPSPAAAKPSAPTSDQ
jgi:TonB family protein